jgi:hypothetical protein
MNRILLGIMRLFYVLGVMQDGDSAYSITRGADLLDFRSVLC